MISYILHVHKNGLLNGAECRHEKYFLFFLFFLFFVLFFFYSFSSFEFFLIVGFEHVDRCFVFVFFTFFCLPPPFIFLEKFIILSTSAIKIWHI